MICIALIFKAFFIAIFVDFLRFRGFWGSFWQAKWKPKSIFATFSPTFCSSGFRDRIFIVFWKRQTSKIMLSPRREHDFNKIDVFEKYPKIFDSGLIFGGQNGEKSRKTCIEKHVFFEHRILCVCLRILTISARFWEAPGSPQIAKIFKKSSKNCKTSQKIVFRPHSERV